MLTTVTASEFHFETAQRNTFTFDGDVSASFTKDDLTVWNLSSATEPTLNRNSLALVNSAGNSWDLTFPGYTYAAVPDGNYETIIEKEGITGLAADHVLPFWFYSADFNRDRKVDIGDFSILAANFNTPQNYSGGDTTYDGQCEIGDFSIMAAKFNMSLNPPPTEPNTLSLCGLVDPVTLNPYIHLNWSLPADPPPGEPPRLGFRVWRSTDGVDFGNSPYAQINGPNATTFDDYNVIEGQHYWYRVRAFSDAGNSETTPKKDMITSLKMPVNVTAMAQSQTQILISWIDQSTVETSFDVYRTLDGFNIFGKVGTIPSTNPPATGGVFQFTDTAASPGTTYRYYVVARNAHQDSMPSLSALAATASSGMTLTATAVSEEEVTLSWTAIAGADSYKVEFAFDAVTFDQGGELDTSSATASIQGIDPEMSVFARVLALGSGEEGGEELAVLNQSNTAGATTQASTSQPYVSPNGPASGGTPIRLNVAWYGLDQSNNLSPGDWRVESITDKLGGTVNPRDKDNDGKGEPYKFNRGREAMVDLFARIDGVNGNPRDNKLTQAEVDSVHVYFLGYSWGAISAINESRRLQSPRTIYGYELTTRIEIEALVVLDPINAGLPRVFMGTHGPVASNVKWFQNFFQTKGGQGTIRWSTNPLGPFDTNDPYSSFIGNAVTGAVIRTDAPGIQIPITTAAGFATTNVTRGYVRTNGQFVFGQSRGNEANHVTLPWYVGTRAVRVLDPTLPDDFVLSDNFGVFTAEG